MSPGLPKRSSKNQLIVMDSIFQEVKVSGVANLVGSIPSHSDTHKASPFGYKSTAARDTYDAVTHAPGITKTPVPTGRILVQGNNTDCIVCGLLPGQTSDHIPTELPNQCTPLDVCGSSVNEILNLAQAQATTVEELEKAQRLQRDVQKKIGLYQRFEYLGEEVVDPKTGRRRRRHLQEDGISYNPEVLPGAYLMTGPLTVYCNYADASLNSNEITTNCTTEAVVKSIMADLLSASLDDHVDIAAAEQKVRPYFVEQINPL